VATKYDDAVAALYRAPHGDFVAERKRLAKELTAAGDKSGAASLAKLPRPSISAWATNQLFARDPEAVERLFASAQRLREGDLEAGAEHRKLTAKLVARAAEILEAAAHGTSEATLRRVSANLAALAAAGGFDPDPPGALGHDRDPPGFDALAFGASEPASAAPKPASAAPKPATARTTETRGRAAEHDEAQRERDEAARARAEAARAKAEAEAERRRGAEERARAQAERRRLESALRAVKADVERHTHERERLKTELTKTENELELSLASERELEARLAKLP
jgi:hypothetical protein